MNDTMHTIAKVLVVEDFSDTLDILCKILEKNRFSVERATSMEEARQKVEVFGPDVVILDINLPDGSGLDLLPEIKQGYPDMVVILLTAYTDLENAIRAVQEGADDFLTKPFETEYLVHSIRRSLEKKRLKERLRQAEKFRTIGEMAAGIAHDFNNILAAIGAHCQVLSKRLNKENEFSQHIKAIEMAVKDGASMVDRLRHLGGKRCEIVEEIFIDQVAKDVVLMTKPKWHHEMQQKGRTIKVETQLAQCPKIRINSSDLREVLINLIFNAVDAMPNGGTLWVRTFHVPGVVGCEVEDTGIGMDGDILERIFDPFFTTKGHGTGLGLSISYAIIQQYGGDIRVESSPGRGTKFTIELPASQ